MEQRRMIRTVLQPRLVAAMLRHIEGVQRLGNVIKAARQSEECRRVVLLFEV